ncbi:chemotaxis protein CheB [Hymenobacter koreensis]|uniref:protein-glutamate methylesterase n=1 Tax=Hymenobacter koreensis TaxID=1084523 RepID=A0ABP8JAW9_9BACT
MPATNSSFTVILGDLPSLARLELAKLLRAEAQMHVVVASNGTAELELQIQRHRPQLIIVGEESLLRLEQLKSYSRAPILVYTATPPWPAVLREAQQRGAHDYLPPLLPPSHPDSGQRQREVLRKVRSASAQGAMHFPNALVGQKSIILPPRGIVVIGGSTGGAAAVERVVSGLRAGLPYAVVVAVHLPAAFTASLVERIRRASVLPVVTGEAGLRLRAGHVVVVPGGGNMVVKSAPGVGWVLQPTAEPTVCFDEPSIDLLMRSAARVAGRQAVGVVLSGLGSDGTLGAHAVRLHGGVVVAQDADTAAVFAMPKSVIEAGLATATLPLPTIASYLNAHALPQRIWPATIRPYPVTRSIS